MNIGFENRTVIVTGAAHGFGRAIAMAFASKKAQVYACDIDGAGTRQTARLCAPGCKSVILDVGERDAVQAAVAKIEAAKGKIDILVNNAGGVCAQLGRPLEDVSAADWQAILDVNLSGAFYMAQAVAPAMKRQKSGRIVNISSGAGRTISLTGIQAYASAKAGQIGLTRQLAHELGAWNITVNCIAPGFVLSNPASKRQWAEMGKKGQDLLLAKIALHRLGTPQDIANAVLFLASEQAGWITGEVLGVDGGK